MMKRFYTALILVAFLAVTVAAQNTLVPFTFTFTGKWNPSGNPLLLDDNGLQDIQNQRKAGKHFKGVSGHTKINSTALSTYPYILNGFHFKKDNPAESHVVVYAADAFTPTAGRLYQNQNKINILSTSSIVPNGSFTSATTGWSVLDSTIASVAGGQSGNCLEITRTGGTFQYAAAAITTEIGRRYTITFYVKSGSSGNEAYQVSHYTSGGGNIIGASGTSSASWVSGTFKFTATDSTTSIVLWKMTATAGTMLFDEVTVYEGDFETTVLYTPTAFDYPWRFSAAPNGNMVASNGYANLIWGGTEMPATAFITSTAAVTTAATNPGDYSDIVENNSSSNAVTITSTVLVGSPRPLQGVKFYVSSGNASNSTMTGQEWRAAGWTALTITDNTTASSKTLAQTGTVTWAASGLAQQRVIEGYSLYWYQFTISAGSATIYYFTVDAPINTIQNVWSGFVEKPLSVLYKYSPNEMDYTADMGDASSATYIGANGMSTSSYIKIGFTNRQQGIEIYFVPGDNGYGGDWGNDNSCTVKIEYWSGTAWTEVTDLFDGTKNGSDCMAQHGIIVWTPPVATGEQKTSSGSNVDNFYYYKLTASANLDGSVRISEIRGVPVSNSMTTYKFSEQFQGRLFLCNETTGAPNTCTYSNYNAPDIFNGEDSGKLSFGDMTEVTAAATIYNVFQSTATDMMIITKANETYRLSGESPTKWLNQRMSSNIGCVAPLTMAAAEVTESSADVKRTVALWQSGTGVVMTDGAVIVPISDDIKCYWDPNDSRYIPAAMQTKSQAWYDPTTQSYKLLIASGASATYLNTELEYSLKYKEWTKIYRENAVGANPLQSGFKVYDANGLTYTYGGGKDGYMYRLENGNNWDGVANIDQYLHTKDLILDNDRPMFRKSTGRYLRTLYKQKTAATGNLTINHYGDRGAATVTGTAGQVAPSVITTIPTTLYNTQSVTLGPYLYHSFKFSQTTDAADGMELLGFGVYYEPLTTFRQ
jgi:hypothetical protein